MEDFDDTSSGSTVCLQVPDSPTNPWPNMVAVHHAGSSELSRRTLGAVNKTAGLDVRAMRGRLMDGGPLTITRRCRPSSASSSTSSAG